MNIVTARTDAEVREALGRFSASAAVGCDTETNGLDPKRARLLSIQFSDGKSGVFVPIEGTAPRGLDDLLADPSGTKIFHNAGFDLRFLRASGLRVENVFDTMVAERVLTKGADQSVSLAETLYRHFAIDLDKSGRRSLGRNWNGVWTKDLVSYAMSDVIHLPMLMSEQLKWMKKLALEEDYRTALTRILRNVDDSFA